MDRFLNATSRSIKRGIVLALWFKLPSEIESNNKRALFATLLRLFCLITVIVLIILWVFYNENYYDISLVAKSETVMDQYGYFKTNFTKEQFDPEMNVTNDQLSAYNRFWVPNDYVKQSSDENEFSIFTNFGITNVTQGICPEDPQFDVVVCDPKNYSQTCKQNKQSANGIQTGNCVQTKLPIKYIKENRRYVCEVNAWCPVAIWPPLQQNEGAILSQTKDTVLSIQNFVEFPEFGINLRTADRPALDCLYDPVDNQHCPYFKLEDIIKYAKYNTKTYEEIATKTGAVIEIRIEWNCSITWRSDSTNCNAGFSFWRQDNENSDPPPLWVFWGFEKTTPDRRVMTYGWRIKFQITVSGTARRFSFYKLLTNLFAYGSLLGLTLVLFTIFVKWCTSAETLRTNDPQFFDIILSIRNNE